jgi:hypothetical protein
LEIFSTIFVLPMPTCHPRLGDVFGIEILCTKCKAPLCLIALIKSENAAKKILTTTQLLKSLRGRDVPALETAA